MITSMIFMTIYFVKQGLNAIDRATEPEDDEYNEENDIYYPEMDYDEAVQWYIVQRDKEDKEIHFD